MTLRPIIVPALLLLLGVPASVRPLFGAETPPNVVLIIADDLNWDDTGMSGNPRVRTPNIDRLAREGMRFDAAFVTASSCSPSRASVITGRYPHATDAEQLHWPVPAEQVTFVEKLREAGYWCGAAGKWHLGEPMKERFDVVLEADPAGFQLPTGPDGKPGKMVASDPSGCKDWLPLLQSRPDEKPFLLWLAALDPHREYEPGIIDPPHRPEEVRVPPYLPDVPEIREELALYHDEITRLDGFIGQVLEELERQGVAENTLVLFFSDNGRPFPRDKTTIYDGGIKTPWIVRYPGRVAAGSSCESLVSAVDIAPTVLELAGLAPLVSVQGMSFVPLLDDPTQSVRDYIYAEDHWHDYEDLSRAVRDERYKYIRNYYDDLPGTPPADVNRSATTLAMRRLFAAGELTDAQQSIFVSPRAEEELYDTQVDPFELTNLADDPRHANVLKRMRGALVEWQRATDDTLPTTRTPDEFNREDGSPLPTRIRPRPSKREMFGEN